jgi:hypothetical protein
MSEVHLRWRRVFGAALANAWDELHLGRVGVPRDAFVALVATFNAGLLLERLIGLEVGHADLLAAIDGWLSSRGDAERT